MNVLLIAGGWSEEREVSLNGALQIKHALEMLGHNVSFFDLVPDLNRLCEAARKCDFAFINLHGCPGEDGSVQALLDDLQVPYLGSGPAGSLTAINKSLSKQIFQNHGLLTPAWSMLTPDNRSLPPDFSFPLIAKPNSGGSSLGLAIINNLEEYKQYIDSLPARAGELLIEEFIPGIELTCAVLDNQALPPILIKPCKSSFFDYSSKYDPDGAQEICPAPVPDELTEKLQAYSLKAHQVLGLRHYSRTDFIYHETKGLFLLETNTLPGMTRTSLVPKAALAAGMDFKDLIQKLVNLALSSSSC